jgi:hypothetical protein
MKIDFEIDTEFGKFADALWFSDEEATPDDATLEIMKQERVNNWVQFIKKQSNLPAEGNHPIEVNQITQE